LWFSFGLYIVCSFFVFLWPYNGQKKTTKGQSIMVKEKREKDKQYKGQRKTTKGQTK
jgi:hypothetical protein